MKCSFVLLVASLSLSYFCAEANWELQFRVHSYIHLGSQRDFEGRHCDLIPDDPCENYFIFCLQTFGWPQASTFCALGSHRTDSRLITSTSATFPLGQNVFAIGADNPLIYRGSSSQAWIQSFQFQIRVNDKDIDSDDLIDRVFVVGNGVAISDSFTSVQTYTGIYNNVRMEVSYRAVCQADYYGPTCTAFCSGRNDSAGRYECDTEGQPVCLQGWTDAANLCLTPICSPSCPTNSECTAPGQCSCLAGWSGESCDQCVPATGCVHGTCSLPGECICDPGYSGALCQIDDDVCGHQSPCLNNGTCNNTGPNSHTCSCPPQFHGPNCESDVDECSFANSCLNGATCVNHDGSFSCVCPAGFTGQDCGINIDNCASDPCQNGASCVDILDDFMCMCLTGFTGAVCDIDINDCHPDVCLNGGTCNDQVDGYNCSCLPRYTGNQCEEQVPPPCFSSPCPANTFCVQDVDANTFTCEDCQPGFESCDTSVIVDPDAQQGNNSSTVAEPLNGMLIGGVVGGVVGALLLLCLVIAMVILCVKCCTCCPCVQLKRTDVDQYQTIGYGARQNPLYFGTSTLLSNSSQSSTFRSSPDYMSHYDGVSPHYAELSTVASEGEGAVDFAPPRQHSNPMYSLAQAAIYSNGGTPPTLPAPRSRSSIVRPSSPSHSPHYERLPEDNAALPPQQTAASGNYNHLKIDPAAGSQIVATSGKYDNLAAPVNLAKDNPYVIDGGDGYRVLPPNPRPAAVVDSKPPMTNETHSTPLPPTNFNPYDSS